WRWIRQITSSATPSFVAELSMIRCVQPGFASCHWASMFDRHLARRLGWSARAGAHRGLDILDDGCGFLGDAQQLVRTDLPDLPMCAVQTPPHTSQGGAVAYESMAGKDG